MNTTETIAEIYRQTEHQRGPLTPQLLCTMAKQQGVYPAKRVTDGRLVNDYSQAQANYLARIILALKLSKAAEIMTARLGWEVHRNYLKWLCDKRRIRCVGNPHRISTDTLAELEDSLTQHRPRYKAEPYVNR